ncbi:Mlr5326 protein [Neorhizobium galegae bv. orientalis]|nr:Mlr5326 protein [Neorhizobium galegae bv. orientalis]
MSAKIILMTAALSALLAGPLAAQEMKGMDHSKMGTPTGGSPSTKAFEDANAKMHKDMAIRYSGDTDADFVRSMIPHHQGAIDMAKVELAHGKDPEIRKLAEAVIKAQEAEIADMQAWLKAHGK